MKFLLQIACTLLCASTYASLYRQIIEVEYDSAKDAKIASAEILKFPEDKKIAFSTRWDDTNLRHVDTVKMLKEHGLKATCYFVGTNLNQQETKAAMEILEMGGSIGAHTINHPFLDARLPNEIFRQIALERAWLEAKFDTNVTAFVLPYTTYSTSADPYVKKYIAMSLLNARYLAEPEPHTPNKQKYDLTGDCDLLSSHTFAANDRDPDKKLFNAKLDAALKSINDGGDPHITLGIHSWQTDEGLQRLGGFIDERKSDDFWYCNENEYAAYRIQFLKSKLEKISAQGNIAKFALDRPDAADLGNDIALSTRFSDAPKSIKLNGKNLKIKNGICEIPHDTEKLSPKKIEYISMPTNSKNLQKLKKFDGLKAALCIDGSMLELVVENKSGNVVNNLRTQWILPPNFAAQYFDKPSTQNLDDGKKLLRKINLAASYDEKFLGSPEVRNMPNSQTIIPIARKEKQWTELFKEGDITLIACCDFLYNGTPARVWLSTVKEQPLSTSDCPRDRARLCKVSKKTDAPDSTIAKMSEKDAVLKDFGDNKWFKPWIKKVREFRVQYDGYALRHEFPKADFTYLVAMDFTAERASNYKLHCNPRIIKALYLNGKKLDTSKLKDVFDISLDKGANRLLAEFGGSFYNVINPTFTIKDGGSFLKCTTPKHQ